MKYPDFTTMPNIDEIYQTLMEDAINYRVPKSRFFRFLFFLSKRYIRHIKTHAHKILKIFNILIDTVMTVDVLCEIEYALIQRTRLRDCQYASNVRT